MLKPRLPRLRAGAMTPDGLPLYLDAGEGECRAITIHHPYAWGWTADHAEAYVGAILALPDLLAACELALPHLVHELAADTVRAAIAKAKGVTDAED